MTEEEWIGPLGISIFDILIQAFRCWQYKCFIQ